MPDVVVTDPPTWDQVARQYGRFLYTVAFRLTGNHDDAQDLVQEVLVRVQRGLATYRPGSMEGWLSRIATNAFLDDVRRRKRRPLDLVGDDIDICARIFSVADAFDAITSDRVYRKGRSYEAAAEELDQWTGRQFDPRVVEAFHRVPQEDWDELRRRSLLPKPAGAQWDSLTGATVESQLNAPAS